MQQYQTGSAPGPVLSIAQRAPVTLHPSVAKPMLDAAEATLIAELTRLGVTDLEITP